MIPAPKPRRKHPSRVPDDEVLALTRQAVARCRAAGEAIGNRRLRRYGARGDWDRIAWAINVMVAGGEIAPAEVSRKKTIPALGATIRMPASRPHAKPAHGGMAAARRVKPAGSEPPLACEVRAFRAIWQRISSPSAPGPLSPAASRVVPAWKQLPFYSNGAGPEKQVAT